MLGMTLRELAEASDVSVQTLLDYMQRRRTLRPSTLLKIQEALERRGISFSNGGTPTVTLDRSKAVIPT